MQAHTHTHTYLVAVAVLYGWGRGMSRGHLWPCHSLWTSIQEAVSPPGPQVEPWVLSQEEVLRIRDGDAH